MLQTSSPALFVLLLGVATASVVDVRTRRIPNAVTAPMALVGLALGAMGAGELSLGASAAGALVGLVLMTPGYALGATGAGDVKLLAAIGALVGPVIVVWAFLWTAIAGGVMALGVALYRGRLAATLGGTGRLLAAPADARRAIGAAATTSRFAYGPAIAIGALIAVLA